jgi:hypothetical protein
VPATVVRRLEKLEAARRVVDQERHDAAVPALGRTMEPEHVRIVQDWMQEHLGGLKARIALTGESPYATLERLKPPALVRAVWLLLDGHARTGCPVSLAPEVAEVYLADPDAWPMSSCESCGYPLPMRGTVQPDGSFSDVAYYVGRCPVCGRGSHHEEDPSP